MSSILIFLLFFFISCFNLYAGHSITYSDDTFPCFSSDGTFNLYNKVQKVSPEVSSLLKERDKLSKLLAHYSGENIRLILMNASKKLPKKKYLFLLRKLKKAKNLSQKIKALKALTIKKK